MMNTTTTPSEPTGTKLTDILFRAKGQYKTIVCGLTPEGWLWIRKNMWTRDLEPLVVDTEYDEELKELIEKDGLTVSYTRRNYG